MNQESVGYIRNSLLSEQFDVKPNTIRAMRFRDLISETPCSKAEAQKQVYIKAEKIRQTSQQ